jgi:prepilin-type N-terminal cleavage/methylation domain-containing protein
MRSDVGEVAIKQVDRNAFTLIELAIVLVIIGLVVGGVLVGQDLVRSAGVRAQISQIEQYQTAVRTFQGKYGALPGDIGSSAATQFGFAGRTGVAYFGDNNGVIEGGDCNGNPGGNWNPYGKGQQFGGGETLMFWNDLAVAGFVAGSFSVNTCGTTNIGAYFPPAVIGGGNYVLVYSLFGTTNYFGIAQVQTIGSAGWGIIGQEGVTVKQAYAMDGKIDDGNPMTGRVMAVGIVSGGNPGWSGARWLGGNPNSDGTFGLEFPGALARSVGTCYDNNNVGGAPFQYSISQNNGAGVNCSLSFQFQ